MRDRLIELFREINYQNRPNGLAANLATQFTDFALGEIADALLSNGVIVPPCKVGDAVYAVSNNPQNTIVQCRVSAFEITTHDAVAIIDIIIGDLVLQRQRGIYFGNFGKTVFLTREEAEKSLLEREGKG